MATSLPYANAAISKASATTKNCLGPRDGQACGAVQHRRQHSSLVAVTSDTAFRKAAVVFSISVSARLDEMMSSM